MSIEPNPYLMLLVFTTFMCLIYLLNRWLFKPIFAFMNDRDSFIENEVANAQSNKNEIQAIEDEITKIISKARKEAAQILDVATKEAKAAYESKLSAEKAENENRLMQRRQELEQEKHQLYAELLEQLPTFKAALNAKLKQI